MRRPEIDYMLTTMLDSHDNVSDLNFTVGKSAQVEASGQLVTVPFEKIPFDALTPFQTEIFAMNLINSDRRLTETLIKEGSCDSSYYLPDKARFRVNIFSQRGSYSIVMRRLSTVIPTLTDLKVPEVLSGIAEEKNGMVLVTGATGSGKSSTLAAVLRLINENKSVHVLTLEDPVEFAHPHIKATFNQREMGIDFDSFAGGLRAALRQAPKVILVGEMRDRETVEIGLSAAETGHLVLSTLHTIDAGQTINRIVGMFE
ncbi:MAG TPA: twitching motility protein, partial [Nitrospiraceae bacterium]|nr:twitching motility protein [Nitrospiraceae bacterium]